MKKIVSLILAALMAFAALPAFAAPDTKDMEACLTLAKSLFEIPEKHSEFTSSSYENNGFTTWNFNWNTPNTDDRKYGYTSVSVASGGVIANYYTYSETGDYSPGKTLMKLSKAEAAKLAGEKAAVILGSLAAKYDLAAPKTVDSYSGRYVVTFNHYENGILVQNENASVTIDGNTGEVKEYYNGYNPVITYPAPEKIITESEAQEKLAENGAVRLIYAPFYEDKTVTVKLVYALDSGVAVDAFTGELAKTRDWLYTADSAMGSARFDQKAMAENALTPEERAEIEKFDNFLEAENVLSSLRKDGIFDIDSELTINSTSYSSQKPYYSIQTETKYTLTFFGNYESQTGGQYSYSYANATVDAVTGEVSSFYASNKDTEKKAADYDAKKYMSFDKAQAAAEKAAKKYAGEKLASFRLKDNLINDGESRSYSITYERVVNGIPFPSDSISVTVDRVSGKVTNYNLNWTNNLQFPSADGIITIDEAQALWLTTAGISLKYGYGYFDLRPLAEKEKTEKTTASLNYSYGQDKGAYIDAETKAILGYDGKPFETARDISYDDIDGHFAQSHIEKLIEQGIYLKGTSFSPDKSIVQRDFLIFVAQTTGKGYYYDGMPDKELYSQLIREGVINESEVDAAAIVTRETAAKFIARALGYGKIIGKGELFAALFSDQAEVAPENAGAAVILKGLGIIGGIDGAFRPKADATRAQAAVMMYNILASAIK